jgi:hypothetical protein
MLLQDLIVLDLGLKIEQVVSAHPRAHLLASVESELGVSTINSGLVIVRNSPWTLAFLDRWWTTSDARRIYSDQEVFDVVYQQYKREEHASKQTEGGLESKVMPPSALSD